MGVPSTVSKQLCISETSYEISELSVSNSRHRKTQFFSLHYFFLFFSQREGIKMYPK